jgi:hypothetical protein
MSGLPAADWAPLELIGAYPSSFRRSQWLLIEEINPALRKPAVTALSGGVRGGGSVVTPVGERIAGFTTLSSWSPNRQRRMSFVPLGSSFGGLDAAAPRLSLAHGRAHSFWTICRHCHACLLCAGASQWSNDSDGRGRFRPHCPRRVHGATAPSLFRGSRGCVRWHAPSLQTLACRSVSTSQAVTAPSYLALPPASAISQRANSRTCGLPAESRDSMMKYARDPTSVCLNGATSAPDSMRSLTNG